MSCIQYGREQRHIVVEVRQWHHIKRQILIEQDGQWEKSRILTYNMQKLETNMSVGIWQGNRSLMRNTPARHLNSADVMMTLLEKKEPAVHLRSMIWFNAFFLFLTRSALFLTNQF